MGEWVHGDKDAGDLPQILAKQGGTDQEDETREEAEKGEEARALKPGSFKRRRKITQGDGGLQWALSSSQLFFSHLFRLYFAVRRRRTVGVTDQMSQCATGSSGGET